MLDEPDEGAQEPKRAPAETTSVHDGGIDPATKEQAGLKQQQQQQQQDTMKSVAGRPNSAAASVQKSTSRTSLMSDTTTLSVCSLSSAATSSTAATAGNGASGAARLLRPATQLKKSASSLSSSASSRRNSSRAPPAAPGELSFSGIRRPGATASSSSSSTTQVSGGGGGGGGAAIKQTKPNSTTRISINKQTAAQPVAVHQQHNQMRSSPATLAMSLRDKDQQIKLLIKERDERRAQAELMAQKADEWREKFEASELERSHVTSEADDEVVELRRLAQEFEDENKRLAAKLIEREQQQGELEFKLNELECERLEMSNELELKESQLIELEEERKQLIEGHRSGPDLITERTMSKAKYEREIEELKERITCRDEQLIQLRSSLEMRKNEVNNLQGHASDLERRLKIESERSERHLKRIDEINLELKAAEDKLATKSEAEEVQEKQVRQLRHELRLAEEKLEQISLARKRDVDILHNKLSAARRGSTTPTGAGNASPQPNFKTPTPQDEIVRLQMEIRDLKDQLIDREAELDCNRRDLDVIKRKMETRTLEVDCNNQELARRCQDLLEQNRQSEDTIKQLLKSTAEHSASLMRATEDLREANGKCAKLREEIQELERRLEEQLQKSAELARENNKLRDENEEHRDQIDLLRDQVQTLNDQIGDLCLQLDLQSNNLHRDREALADELSKQEIARAQLAHDLATAKQDLRSQKLVQQEVENERERLRSNLEMKEKFIKSREEVLETMRAELEDCQKSLADYKAKLEALRSSSETELNDCQRELKQQVEQLRQEVRAKLEEGQRLAEQCGRLEAKCRQLEERNELEVDEKFDEMRRKHSAELDELLLKIKTLEEQHEQQQQQQQQPDEDESEADKLAEAATIRLTEGSQVAADEVEQINTNNNNNKLGEYETQIEFLNSLVVDMQRKCDDYKNRLALFESASLISELDKMFQEPMQKSQQTQAGKAGGIEPTSRSSTLKRANNSSSNNNNNNNNNNQAESNLNGTMTRQRVVRIQDPLDELLDGVERAQRQTRHISGRPYCDLCQVYDRHHTVYCPRVDEKLAARLASAYSSSNNYNNNNNNQQQHESNNNYHNPHHVDEMFREYEESLRGNSKLVAPVQFASLRRPSATANQRD